MNVLLLNDFKSSRRKAFTRILSRLVVSEDEKLTSGEAVELQTADKRCTLKLRALPLPAAATKLLEDNAALFRDWILSPN